MQMKEGLENVQIGQPVASPDSNAQIEALQEQMKRQQELAGMKEQMELKNQLQLQQAQLQMQSQMIAMSNNAAPTIVNNNNNNNTLPVAAVPAGQQFTADQLRGCWFGCCVGPTEVRASALRNRPDALAHLAHRADPFPLHCSTCSG